MKFHSFERWNLSQFAMRVVFGLVLLVSLVLFPLVAANAVIAPGVKAPSFSLSCTDGKLFTLDDDTSTTSLLVFVKPGDKYLGDAVEVLNDVFSHHPKLKNDLNRTIVLSRVDANEEIESVVEKVGKDWSIAVDEDDNVYHDYDIIATPTIVIVGPDGFIVAVNPGYDSGMAQHVRVALAKSLGVDLPVYAVSGPSERPNMNLQMGRRLAERGLWAKALMYFDKAGKETPHSPEIQLEIAEIYLEMKSYDKFDQLVKKLESQSPDLSPKIRELQEREVQMKEDASTLTPSKINR